MIWLGEAHNRDPELGNEHKSTEDEEDNEGNEDEAEEETSSSCTLLSEIRNWLKLQSTALEE